MGMDALNNTNVNLQKTTRVAEEAPSVRTSTMPKIKDAQVKNESGKGQPTADEIKSAIASANRRAHFGHTNAEFSYHEATKRISVKIIDEETNEVIREIPPEETLEMISKMWELAGIMVDEKR